MFDEIVDRRGTGSFKWSGDSCGMEENQILPMWVADMDFACPAPIVEAVARRAAHPLYGYTQRDEDYEGCIAAWMKRRYGFEPDLNWIAFAPPGVIYAVYTMLRLLTVEGDGVLVMMPNYDPLHEVVTKSGRRLVESALQIKEGRVEIDFADLEQKLRGDVKLMILSNPHNPSGRVWTREELERISELCEACQVYVISDEIHGDFVSAQYGHTAFPSLSRQAAKNCMACYSANKGFNLGGLQTAALVIADEEKKAAFEREMGIGQTRLDNIFGIAATKTAYTDPACEAWLDQAIEYVEENKRLLYDFLKRKTPEIQAVKSEGTYLVWLSCQGLGLSQDGGSEAETGSGRGQGLGEVREIEGTTPGKALERFFMEEAKVQPCMGYEFGSSGDTFVRLNLACPRKIVMEALNRIERAVVKRRK